MKRMTNLCIRLSIITCLVFILNSYTQTTAAEYISPESEIHGSSEILQSGSYSEIILTPVDISLPTFNDTGDLIDAIHQAWFAFDMSSIPSGSRIVSATLSLYLYNMSMAPSWRYLWYYSDDSWIFYPTWLLSDPGEDVIADQIVGFLLHDDSPGAGYVWKEFQINYDGWDDDLADGYISLMITGGQSGAAGITPGNLGYTWGVEKDPELTLIITSVAQPITVTSPNGGESFQAETEQTITWISDASAGPNVKIELYQNYAY